MSKQIARYRADRDAMGHMLLDYYNSGDALQIIEREDGLIDGSDYVGNYFADFSDWPAFEQEAIRHLVPGRTLDLGCGAGRVALYLQSQACEVTGIDNSPLAIEVCRLRGVQDARVMSITQVGPGLGTFSNIAMFGSNWGLMGSYPQAKRLLRRFYQITTPGARILAASNNIYGTSDPLHLNYHAYNRERGRMPGQIRMRVRHSVYRTAWFDYLMVSKEEMQEILSGSGWGVEQFIDSEGAAYTAVIVKE